MSAADDLAWLRAWLEAPEAPEAPEAVAWAPPVRAERLRDRSEALSTLWPELLAVVEAAEQISIEGSVRHCTLREALDEGIIALTAAIRRLREGES